MTQNQNHPQQLMQFILGKWISKPIYAAAHLGIADILSDGPLSIDELAKKTESHGPSLYRVMRALAGVGIFMEKEDGLFALTPMAELLKKGVLQAVAIMPNTDWNEKAWSFFLDGIKTGETPFVKAFGKPIFPWLEENKEARQLLGEANAIKATQTHRVIADVYDFTGIETLADIGGGIGALMVEILKSNPDLNGIVAELALVIPETRKYIGHHHMEERCKTMVFDFFQEQKNEGDLTEAGAYILSHILHDWPDEECLKILRNIRKLMKPEAKLLVVEMIITDGNSPSMAKLLDLEMFVITGGRERTEEEYRYLFESSGFKLSRTISPPGGVSIMEAIPV